MIHHIELLRQLTPRKESERRMSDNKYDLKNCAACGADHDGLQMGAQIFMCLNGGMTVSTSVICPATGKGLSLVRTDGQAGIEQRMLEVRK